MEGLDYLIHERENLILVEIARKEKGTPEKKMTDRFNLFKNSTKKQ